MKYYFFDTSGIFGIFRNQQLTNNSGNAYWNALNESANPDGVGFGALSIIISSLMPYEAIRGLFLKDQSQETIINIMKFEIERSTWTVIDVTKDVLKKSLELMEKHSSLISFDAIQLACALKAKEDYGEIVFVTGDKILKSVAEKEGLTLSE